MPPHSQTCKMAQNAKKNAFASLTLPPTDGAKMGGAAVGYAKIGTILGSQRSLFGPFLDPSYSKVCHFPYRKVPKNGLFWPFLAPFSALPGHKNDFFGVFSWYFGEFHGVLPISFHFFPILWYFFVLPKSSHFSGFLKLILVFLLAFFTIFSVFSLFGGYFRRFARSNLQGPYLWLSGELWAEILQVSRPY